MIMVEATVGSLASFGLVGTAIGLAYFGLRDLYNFNYYVVFVEYNEVTCGSFDGKQWCIQNKIPMSFDSMRNRFRFKCEEDAMAFKLVWYNDL
jgi:hypothetical protein